MTRPIDELIDAVVTEHVSEPARADAAARLADLEELCGYRLPLDMRAFYLRLHRAELLDAYEILPLDEFRRTGAALQGDEWAESEPDSWWAFCDTFNGDWVGVDLAVSSSGGTWILDCDHESISPRRAIATCFADFLERALSSPDAPRYYLGSPLPFPSFEVPYQPPLGWLRRHYLKWSLDPEVGPELCRIQACSKRRVSHSVHCRRHHFEAIVRLPYPFDE